MAWTEEQLSAINEKGQNIIVSAGAGSGKTAVLTARTLRIIKEGTHVNELLILTFTKAAAAEMKERIRSAISEDSSLKDELPLVDQSYITTFDAFALSVVKKYHYLLNISNNIAISESSIIDMKKEEILDEVFDKYYCSKPEHFSKLIKDFCVKDDVTLKNSILRIATKIDGMPGRDAYFDTYPTRVSAGTYYNILYEDYLKIITEIKERLDNYYEDYLSNLSESQVTKMAEYGSNLYKAKEYDEIYNATTNLPERFPSIKLDEDVKPYKEKYKNTLDELKEVVTKYGTQEEIKNSLEKTNIYVEAILDIIKDFLEELHKYKRENEIYDFQDIALLSIKILEEHESVREELRDSFKEIMIDEYQDTNDIQERFISLIENNNVYMVGDIKQAIYRFRNANPYIFKNKYEEYSCENGGIKIDLLKNFRSREEVLTAVNDIFNLIMDNIIGGAEYHETHQMVYGNKAYIEEGKTDQDYNLAILEYPFDKETPYSKEEIEIFTIARDIQNKIKNKFQVFDKKENKLRDITYKDFAILIDRSPVFDLYKKVFEYLGIPLTLHKDETMSDTDDIYVLKNIIDLIVNINLEEFDTKFKYDFTSIARSYLYNYTDEEIFNYFLNDNFKDSSIYNDFKDIATKIPSLSITELLEQIIAKTNMYEKLITVGNIDESIIRISKLIDIANNLSTLGYNIYTFRDYLNELINEEYEMKYAVEDTGNDAVKIMTIHKSKGLEFSICYYGGLYKEFNIQDLNERILIDNKYGIITPFFEEGIHESMVKYLVKYNYLEEEISERIRLFYVALTRAKEKMIIVTPVSEETDNDLDSNGTIELNIRRKYRSFSQILNSIKNKIIKYYKEIDINSLGITNEYLFKKTKLEKLASKEKPIIVEEISIPTSPEIENKHFSKSIHNLIDKRVYDNMQFGLKAHETLEFINLKNPNYDLIDNEFLKTKIKEFLANPLLQHLNDAKIYREHEFIYQENSEEYHGIIDLMLEYDNNIDIIDYKLNNVEDENYLNQLNGYKEYISSISHKEINIYLYSIISGELKKL